MREEYTAQIDSFASILPEKLRTRFYLKCLNKKMASLAIESPVNGTGVLYAEGVSKQLAEDLSKTVRETDTGTVVLPGDFV